MTEPDAPAPWAGLLHEDPVVHRRRWFLLGIMCLSLVMVVMSVAGLNVALPSLQRELGANASALQWIVDSYGLVFAALLLPFGALGDRFGRKKALMLGLVIFTTGSFVGGLGTDIGPGHRGSGDHRHRCRLRHAGHVVAAHHHLPAPRAAQGHRHVGRVRRRRRSPRADRHRRPAGEVLVGIGVPGERAHRGPRPHRGGRLLAELEGPRSRRPSTRSAPACPWSAWAPSSTGSSRDRRRAGPARRC